jgi:osmotically-inducible protein OsmY
MILRISNQTELETSPPCAIAANAEARFRSDSHTALRGISCTAERGVIVLEGRLSSFYQKQLAQEIVGHIEGVVQVVNQIEVVSGDQSRKVTGLAANLSVRQSI